VVPGTTAGDIVSLTNNISAARTVTIDSGGFPVMGTLNIGDSTTAFFAFTLTAAAGEGLILDNGGNGAHIVQPVTTASDVISTPILLQDNLTVTNKSTLTISEGIFDDGNGRSLTKTGAGKLTLSGTTANAYTGLTTVSAGVLSLVKTAGLNAVPGDILVTGTGQLALGANNQVADTANVTLNNVSPASTATVWLEGGFSETVNNFTNISLTGSDMGGLTINGTLYIPMSGTGTGASGTNTASRVNSAKVTTVGTAIFSGGTIWVLSGQTGSSTFNVGGGGLFLTNATIRFGNDSAPGTFVTLMSLGGDLTASGTNPLNIGPIFTTRANAQIDLGGVTRNFNIVDGSTTIDPVIQNGGLNKTGNGTLTLSATNTYTGGTTVTGGTLALKGGGTLASSQISVTSAGFSLASATNSLVINNNFNLNTATLSLTPNPALTNIVVANLNISGATNLINIASVPGLNYPAQIHLISYTTASGLTNANNTFVNLGLTLPTAGNPAGYLTNNAANNSVDLVLTAGPAPIIPVTWRGNVNGNWDLTTSNWVNSASPATANNFANSALTVFDDTATGTTTINLTTNVFPGSLLVSNLAQTYVFTGAGGVGGTVGLNKQNSGTLVVDNTGTNNFSGAIIIAGGVVQIGNNDTNGSLPATTLITDNGSLALNRTDNKLVLSNAIAGTGSISNNSSGTVTLSGIISTTGAGATVVNNSGVMVLAGANTYLNGATIINGGILQINAAANMGDKSSPFTINNGTLEVTTNVFATSRQFFLGSANSTIQMDLGANLNPSSALTGFGFSGTGTLNKTGPGVLWLSGANNYTGDTVISAGTLLLTGTGTLGSGAYAGNITDNGTLFFSNTVAQVLSGVLSGAGSLTKNAAGILTLSGVNTFSGKTVVSGGTLALTGSAALATTNLSLGANGILDVSALTSAFTLGSGQTLSGTAATGTINGSVNLGSGNLAVTYTNGTPTLAIANGNLTLNNNAATVTVNGTNALAVGSYQLIAPGTAGTVSGSVASSTVTILGAGAGASASLQIVGGGLNLVIAAAQPHFGGITRLPDNNFQLTFTGPASQTYTVHATTNLTLTPISSWPVVGSGTFSAGANTFTDLSATNYSQQFYNITTP
jgi:autotransporter-associated beta strand protein